VRGAVLRLRAGGILDQVHAEICRWTAILELPAWAVTMLRQRERMVSIRRSWPASRSFLHPSQAGHATRPTLSR
jgi:hypothetical protein